MKKSWWRKIGELGCPHLRTGMQAWFYPYLEKGLPEGWYKFCVHCDKRLDFLGPANGTNGQPNCFDLQAAAIRKMQGA